MRANEARRVEIAAAWLVVLAWHALFAWMLLRPAARAPLLPADRGLQVVYLPPPSLNTDREQDTPVPHATAAATRATRAAPTGRPLAATTSRADAQPDATTMQVQVLSGSPDPAHSAPSAEDRFLEQGRQWAAGQARAAAGPADPFARHEVQLPGAGVDRFRMRQPVSAAGVVSAVGTYLFSPAGYDADPCPRNRSNIGRLMAGGDSAALRQEVEFERRHCRS
jgi:hypothetical protein